MKKYYIFYVFTIFLSVSIIHSCSKPEDENSEVVDDIIDDDDNNGGDDDAFNESIEITYVLDGEEHDIVIDQYIGAYVESETHEGHQLKRFELVTGYEDTFPKMYMVIPFRVGDVEFGTTYGEDGAFLDYFSFNLNDDITYTENTEYADIVSGQWIQPWLEIFSINHYQDNEYEVYAAFGGTLIYYDSEGDVAQTITIKSGNFRLLVPDDYSNVVDNSAGIAHAPQIGGGSGGGSGQNDIIADFEIRYPGTYVSGTQMLFDTATLTIVNKSSNAITLEFELTSGDYWFSENYFLETTQIGIGKFSKTMKLKNNLDTNSFTVKLTAYDEHGNSKTAFRSVDLPIIRTQMFINGDLVENTGIICYEEYDSDYSSQYEIFGILFEDISTFHFGEAGYFPTPGTVLDDLSQTGSWFIPSGDYSFYLEKSYPNGGSTFDDPDGVYSNLELNNYSIQVVNNSIHEIFGSVYAEYTLNDPTGPTGTVEFRYLAPYSKFYNFKNHKERELYEGKTN